MHREVQPRRDAATGQDVAVVDDPGIDHCRVGRPQVLDCPAVCHRGPAVEQTGPGEDHPAGTDAGNSRPAVVCRRDGLGQVPAFGLCPDAGLVSVVPSAAGHDEQVRHNVGERAVRLDPKPMARGDYIRFAYRAKRHVPRRAKARRVLEHLVGADGVQFVEPVETGDCDSVHAHDTADSGK